MAMIFSEFLYVCKFVCIFLFEHQVGYKIFGSHFLFLAPLSIAGALTRVHRILKALCYMHAREQWHSSSIVCTAQEHPYITYICYCSTDVTNWHEASSLWTSIKGTTDQPVVGCFACNKAWPTYLQKFISFSNSWHPKRWGPWQRNLNPTIGVVIDRILG